MILESLAVAGVVYGGYKLNQIRKMRKAEEERQALARKLELQKRMDERWERSKSNYAAAPVKKEEPRREDSRDRTSDFLTDVAASALGSAIGSAIGSSWGSSDSSSSSSYDSGGGSSDGGGSSGDY